MAMRFEKAKEYTRKYKGILGRCKYCGNQDIRIFSTADNKWFVACMTKSCDCTGSYTSVKNAIKQWNDKHLIK